MQSPSPKKALSKQASKVGKNTSPTTPKTLVSVKLPSPNGKGTTRARRLSYTADEVKPVACADGIKTEEANTQK